MESLKDKGSRNGSKANLNESNMPLLEDESLEKDKIELKERASTNSKEEDEKDDSKTEKQDETGNDVNQQPTEEIVGEKKTKKQKPKKEKKPKDPQEPSGITKLSIGLNLNDRDEKHNNENVNIQFEDIICEPDSSHSFDGIWRLTFIIFSATKLWSYRLLSAIIALPCAIFCGLNFAIFTCIYVWAITPLMRLFQINIHFLQRLWSLFFRAIFDPIFQSIGQVFSNINVQRQTV
ncbi:hypothetical protein CHUAL_012089 [Chamberlinius hualienensis]